jgi:hypothetical protein
LREYNIRANRLKSATLQTGDSLSANPTIRLKEDYQYDPIGNLTLRSQYWDQNGFSETFGYDELNRIIQSQVSGQRQLKGPPISWPVSSKRTNFSLLMRSG